MKSRILVIIVTYNAMRWAKRCFDSIMNSTMPVDTYVIDNGSTDGTQEFIKEKYSKVYFIQSPINGGFGKANNEGIRYAIENGYEYVYLLNQDAWVMPDTFEQLVSVSVSNPAYGIISPLQVERNNEYLDQNFARISCGIKSGIKKVIEFQNEQDVNLLNVPFVMAAHWLMPIPVIKEVGIFSPSFPHYREDNNLVERMQYHGYKVGIVPSVCAVHDRANRPISKSKQMHLIYTLYIHDFSNPFKTPHFLWYVLHTIKTAIKYFSIIPIQNLFKVVRDYKSIENNRRISIECKGAFI